MLIMIRKIGHWVMNICNIIFNICDIINNYVTERLCPETKQATHHIYIGSNGPLFKYFSEHGSPPLLALRHDVDGLIWQMPTSDQNWPPNHIGTLPAFGYVQVIYICYMKYYYTRFII